MHLVHYNTEEEVPSIVSDERNSRTMLTQFFIVYEEGREATKYFYVEFPKHYWWDAKDKTWRKRKNIRQVIGRIYAASLGEGERFFLRLLLDHVKGPKSFNDLKTVNGVPYETFKQAAQNLGILEEDESIRQCLTEARTVQLPSALRRLFATILVFCEPIGVRRLWDENFSFMIEDYRSTTNDYVTNRLLHDINSILVQHRKSIKDFDLPHITEDLQNMGIPSTLVDQELSIPISGDDLNSVQSLNAGQLHAFNTISNAISAKEGGVFFVDGPGGTGKTYLYRALISSLRNQGRIILASATSGIAATQLPGGRTSHSKLRIPVKLHSQSFCNFSKQSDMCVLLRRASAILWDVAPMANKNAIETVDRTFRDMLGADLPFGCKVMIFGGEFRQVLPVIVGGTRMQSVQASIVESHIWSCVKLLKLEHNIRALHDPNFANFLLRIGNGEEPTVNNDMIKIPDAMLIPWEDDSSIDKLIEATFPNLENRLFDLEYMMHRAIITPLNEDVHKLNERVLQNQSTDDEVTYFSFDSIPDDTHNMFLPEFLNSLNPGNLPPHKLSLKKGCVIMLLWNIDPKSGLCNGTRLVCHGFGRNFIDTEIITGPFKGTRVLLPRLPLKTSDDSKLPFQMTRKEFPVRLAFALTINKSQGQTIPYVGIYLPKPVF